MHAHLKILAAVVTAASTGLATAQDTTGTVRETGRTAGEVARDAADAAGRAASAAVTPGDQNMGRTPDNRSGGLMGNDRTPRTDGTAPSGTAPAGTDGSGRPARADRN
jgi:hypothetical protein